MNTLGWLFVLAGILIARQVSRGRVMHIAEDLGDAFIAVASGDNQALGVVLARTGDSATPSPDGVEAMGNAPISAADDAREKGRVTSAPGLLASAIARGNKARGYILGATGPTYYDCSGLVWRACQDNGYKGARFTTFDFRARSGFKQISPPATQGPGVTAAGVNDIVIWPNHHMGIVSGPNRFYSARNPKAGISDAAIKGFRSSSPLYYRFTG